MLGDSGLLQQLQRHAHSPAGQPMYIYGDPAYPLRLQLQAPFRNVVLTPQMQAFNSSMSSVRSCVEWLFGDIVNYFKFIDFKKNLKIGLSNIGKLYIVCAVLQNALTCLYGNLTTSMKEQSMALITVAMNVDSKELKSEFHPRMLSSFSKLTRCQNFKA